MKVADFIEAFVGHNSTVTLYKVDGKEYKRVWRGMDWQADGNREDGEYCKEHGFEICPFIDSRVIQVKQFPHENFSDFIDLVII